MNNGEYNNGNNGGVKYEPIDINKALPPTRGFSIASMVLGILSLITCCCVYTPILFGALAVVFALISRKKIGVLDGMSIAGLICGILGFVIGVSIIIYVNTPGGQAAINSLTEEWERALEEAQNGTGGNGGNGGIGGSGGYEI